jgi:epoxyqueuosine reductase
MERDYAVAAGLGWIGKNTLLLNTRSGSLFFIGAILTDLALTADIPFQTDHCGICVACLEACPTGAFLGPRRLDPRRCISYLTIESKSAIDDELSALSGDWAFGCDVCQDVCPWNRKVDSFDDRSFAPSTFPDRVNSVFGSDKNGRLDLAALKAELTMNESAFRAKYARTPILRIGLAKWKRNLINAAANRADPTIDSALVEHAYVEADPTVVAEIRLALKRSADRSTSP